METNYHQHRNYSNSTIPQMFSNNDDVIEDDDVDDLLLDNDKSRPETSQSHHIINIHNHRDYGIVRRGSKFLTTILKSLLIPIMWITSTISRFGWFNKFSDMIRGILGLLSFFLSSYGGMITVMLGFLGMIQYIIMSIWNIGFKEIMFEILSLIHDISQIDWIHNIKMMIKGLKWLLYQLTQVRWNDHFHTFRRGITRTITYLRQNRMIMMFYRGIRGILRYFTHTRIIMKIRREIKELGITIGQVTQLPWFIEIQNVLEPITSLIVLIVQLGFELSRIGFWAMIDSLQEFANDPPEYLQGVSGSGRATFFTTHHISTYNPKCSYEVWKSEYGRRNNYSGSGSGSDSDTTVRMKGPPVGVGPPTFRADPGLQTCFDTVNLPKRELLKELFLNPPPTNQGIYYYDKDEKCD